VDNELAFGCILWDIRYICTRNPIRSNRKTVRSGDPNILSLISFVSGFILPKDLSRRSVALSEYLSIYAIDLS